MSDVDNGSSNATATPPAPWYGSVQDPDLRGFAELKGWDSPEKALTSYRHLEQHMGAPADRLLRLPEKPDDPAWAAVRAKVGFAAPEKPEDYELQVPEGFSDDYAKGIAAKAKELGIPKDMVKGLAEFTNEYAKAQFEAAEKALEQGITASQAALKAEWGGRYEQTMTLAQRAEAAMKADLGVGEDEMLAMMNAAPRAYYKMLAGYGGTIAEAPHVEGNTAANPLRAMSPEAAQTRINQLKADPEFRQKYLDGDHKAMAEMTHLLTITSAAKSR